MPKKKHEIIRRIVRAASATAPKSRRGRTAAFIQAYFARAPVDDLAARPVADLAGAALCHLELARHWTRTARTVRVYNPDRERDGWSSEHTVVDIVTRNSPFLVDSVTMEINRQGFVNHFIVHPMLRLVRTRRGRMTEVRGADEDTDASELTSFIHAEIDRETDPERLRDLETGLNDALDDVRASVRDWKQVMARVQTAIAEMENTPLPLDRRLVQESAEFLRWLGADHFTVLGYRDYDLVRGRGGDSLRIVPGTGLGILRERRGRTR
ncbi:MAG: NAD-glutamate dehydrogenase, partial [Gammaproteobacteria bacterium]